MLKPIDPFLDGTLLAVPGDMGHGSGIAVADANLPAVDLARRHVGSTGVPVERALQALPGVLPLDDVVDAPAAVIPRKGGARPGAGAA